MTTLLKLWQAFVAVEPGSIRGLIGLGDILKSIVLGLVGFAVTVLIAVLPWISTAIIPLIPNPMFDAAAIWGIGFILDILRRLHGGTGVLVPAMAADGPGHVMTQQVMTAMPSPRSTTHNDTLP